MLRVRLLPDKVDDDDGDDSNDDDEDDDPQKPRALIATFIISIYKGTVIFFNTCNIVYDLPH